MISNFVGFIITPRWSSILTLLPIIPTTFFEIPEDTVALTNIISGRYAVASWKQGKKPFTLQVMAWFQFCMDGWMDELKAYNVWIDD